MTHQKTYRRKPLEVEAIQWIGDVVANDVIAWVEHWGGRAWMPNGSCLAIIQPEDAGATNLDIVETCYMVLTDYAYLDIDGHFKTASHVDFQAEFEDIDTRLAVNINSRTADDLRRTAQAEGTTYTELTRRAVAYYALIVDERAEGHDLYFGKVRKAIEL